jgi:DNA-binding response OmpR family regulator
MTDIKPLVVYFGDEQELVDLVTANLSNRFEITPVIGMTDLDDVLDVLRRIKPDYVLIDPRLPNLDHQQLHHRMKTDSELEGTQILIISDDA